jgi:hypothetical protein
VEGGLDSVLSWDRIAACDSLLELLVRIVGLLITGDRRGADFWNDWRTLYFDSCHTAAMSATCAFTTACSLLITARGFLGISV